MDEAEDGVAVLLVEQAVIVLQAAAEFGNFPDKGVALFVVVMQMHFDVADAKPRYLRNAIEQVAPVLFLRIEEAVLGLLAGGVSGRVIGNSRPLIAPPRDAAKRSGAGCTHPQRLVVIGEGNPGALRFCGSQSFAPAVPQIRCKPDFRVTGKIHGFDLPFVRCWNLCATRLNRFATPKY
jgi:hypothetical protein